MAKKKNDRSIKSVMVFVTDDFNLSLKQYMLDLEKLGIHRTKADLIIKLAQVGLMYEKKEIKIEKS
jgi:hypothetical protein